MNETHVKKLLLEVFESQSKKIDLKRGDFIYRQGEQPQNLYLVQNGLMGLFSGLENGRDRLVRFFKPGQFHGHRAIYAMETYHASAKALEPTTLQSISSKHFDEICNNHPQIWRYFCKILAKELRIAELNLTASHEASVSERIAESLVYLLEEYPNHLWTKQEIAE